MKLTAAFFLLFFCFPSLCFAGDILTIRTTKGDVSLQVELADTPETRKNGLMGRDDLCERCGMLFVFDAEESPRFWMKDTPIPLDMIFIGADGVVKGVHRDARPYDETPISSPGMVLGVLEIRGKASEMLGISVGDQVIHKVFEKDLK